MKSRRKKNCKCNDNNAKSLFLEEMNLFLLSFLYFTYRSGMLARRITWSELPLKDSDLTMELLLLLQEMLLPSFHLTLLVLLVSETWKLDRTIPWDDEAQWSPCGLLSLSPELLSSRELESNSGKAWLPPTSICVWNYYKWKIVYIVARSNDFCKLGKYFWRISGMSKVFQSTTKKREN